MKRLQLPKNKYARIFINIIFFILWAELLTFLIAPWGTVGKIIWGFLDLDYFNNVFHKISFLILAFWVKWVGFIGGSIYLWTRKPKKAFYSWLMRQ